MAKRELYRIPIFGMPGDALIPSSGPAQIGPEAIQSAVKVQTRLASLFAEAPDRREAQTVQRRRRLATDAQVPLAPIAVAGAYEITPRRALGPPIGPCPPGGETHPHHGTDERP